MLKFFLAILFVFAAVGGTYATWYSYNWSKVVERNDTCANPMRSPTGEMVCVQEIVPPTLQEKLFGTPERPGCDQSATTTPCSVLNAMVETSNRQEPTPTYDTLRVADVDSYYAEHSTQSGIVDEHVTVDPALDSIAICGRDFVARHIYIDGIDIARRIAEILPKTHALPTNNMTLGEGICSTLGSRRSEYTQYKHIELPVFDAVRGVNVENHTVYVLNIGSYLFQADIVSANIYSIGGYDGTLTLLGTIK